MAYGLSTRLFVENGPAITAGKAQLRSSAHAHGVLWGKLKPAERIDLVERFLRAA